MSFPSPDNLQQAPVWENYLVAQTVQAALGQIPEHAVAVGIEAEGTRLSVRFLLTEHTSSDAQDVADIASELEGLVGNGVQVETTCGVVDERAVTPSGTPTRWVYVARAQR